MRFVEDFQPRERSGMWPSMVTSSLLLLIPSPFPSVHTTWPPFSLMRFIHPPESRSRKPQCSWSSAASVCFQLKSHLEPMCRANSSCESHLFPLYSQPCVWGVAWTELLPEVKLGIFFPPKADLFWNLNALDTCLRAHNPELSIGCLPGGPSLPSRLLHLSEGIATRQSENASFNCDLPW